MTILYVWALNIVHLGEFISGCWGSLWLQYKALITTLWFGGWEDVDDAVRVLGDCPSFLPWKRVECFVARGDRLAQVLHLFDADTLTWGNPPTCIWALENFPLSEFTLGFIFWHKGWAFGKSLNIWICYNLKIMCEGFFTTGWTKG